MAYTPIPDEAQKESRFLDSYSDRHRARQKALQAVAYLRALEMRYNIRYVPHETMPQTWVAVKTLKPEFANKNKEKI